MKFKTLTLKLLQIHASIATVIRSLKTPLFPFSLVNATCEDNFLYDFFGERVKLRDASSLKFVVNSGGGSGLLRSCHEIY